MDEVAARDISDLQVEYALQRPLVGFYADDYSIAVLSNHVEAYQLQLRPNACWNDGTAISGSEWARSVLSFIDDGISTRELFGIELLDADNGLIQFAAKASPTIIRRFLFSIPWHLRMEGCHALYSGDFIPKYSDDDLVVLRHKSSDFEGEIKFHVLSDQQKIANAFHDKTIQLTSPTAFNSSDIVKSGHFKTSCEPNIHAVCVFNPKRAVALCNPAIRRNLIAGRSLSNTYGNVLIPEYWPQPDYKPQHVQQSSKLSIIYSDYFPNKIIAEEIKTNLEKSGIQNVNIKPVSLLDLAYHIANNDYDIALMLSYENQQPKDAMLLKMMAAAIGSLSKKSERDGLIKKYQSQLKIPTQNIDSSVFFDLLARVPIVPLYRFSSCFFQQGMKNDVDLINGSYFSIDKMFGE